MIDYDDLRKKAEAAKLQRKQYERRYELYHPESAEFLYSGPRLEHALAEHRDAATPEVTLRLLEIIEVAKRGLNGHCCGDAHCKHDECRWARKHLDEIAKLEKE